MIITYSLDFRNGNYLNVHLENAVLPFLLDNSKFITGKKPVITASIKRALDFTVILKENEFNSHLIGQWK